MYVVQRKSPRSRRTRTKIPAAPDATASNVAASRLAIKQCCGSGKGAVSGAYTKAFKVGVKVHSRLSSRRSSQGGNHENFLPEGSDGL